jgi:hypothetical protein
VRPLVAALVADAVPPERTPRHSGLSGTS